MKQEIPSPGTNSVQKSNSS